MTDWEAPRDGMFHFKRGAVPHFYTECGDWCAGQGWKGWAAKDTVVDIDYDPGQDPARFGGIDSPPTP